MLLVRFSYDVSCWPRVLFLVYSFLVLIPRRHDDVRHLLSISKCFPLVTVGVYFGAFYESLDMLWGMPRGCKAKPNSPQFVLTPENGTETPIQCIQY